MGEGKRLYRQIPHRFFINHGMAHQGIPHKIQAGKGIRRAAAGVHGNSLVLGDLGECTDMIRVLVGDENGAYRRQFHPK